MNSVVPGSGLRRALALTLVVLLVELAGGLYSHSLALLSDAGHVLTDVFALGLAWFAFAQAQRPAQLRLPPRHHPGGARQLGDAHRDRDRDRDRSAAAAGRPGARVRRHR